MKLNPQARSFEPGLLYLQKQHSTSCTDSDPESEWCMDVLDLPREVIAHILGQITDVEGLLSCAVASKQLCALLSNAPLSINLAAHFAARDRLMQSRLPAALEGLGKYTPDVRQLDLDGLSVENWDVERALSLLPNIRILSCSSCNRLTPHIVSAFSAWDSNSLSPLASLHLDSSASDDSSPRLPLNHTRQLSLEALSLQRCFQLNNSVLTSLLSASSAGILPLTTLAMSHLDLADWMYAEPESVALSSQTSHPSSSSMLELSSLPSLSRFASLGASSISQTMSTLRVLLLNKCTNLSPEGLWSLAEGCPRMQMLFLGGSQLPETSDLASRAELWGMEHLSGRVAEALKYLTVPGSSVHERSVKAGLSCSTVEVQASCLAVLVLAAPELRVLELTFFPQPVLDLLEMLLHKLLGSSCQAATSHLPGSYQPPVASSQLLSTSSHKTCPQLWNFFQGGSIAGALQTLKAVTGSKGPCYTAGTHMGVFHHHRVTEAPIDAAATALALKCGVNCSTATRWTPLHFAALGDADAVVKLIALGANVNARHHGGATPLFLACECGKDARIADLLLQAGADGQMNNAAGESPLYISALRGHANMVRSLLRHFESQQVEWQSPSLYSDGWTPLMAACVADRYSVALQLLLAAGTHAAVMVADKNKYGQNVFHIAARKGSLRLLKLLLSIASTGAVIAHDDAGETPMDVARKNRHSIAETEFNRITVC